MPDPETVVWGIHAGHRGDADTLFLKKSVIALGWEDIGDLSKLAKNRDSFKAKIAEVYPGIKEGAVPNWAGALFRFVHEMQTGDVIVYPSKVDRLVHIGKVVGSYRHAPEDSKSYPHSRAAKWLKAIPRTHFTQGALYEIGSAMSLFQVRNYAGEFLLALEQESKPAPAVTDETVAQVTEDIEQSTKDFVLKQLAQELKGHPFADFVANLLGCMGFRTRVSPEGPDGGIDIVAHKDELGFEPPIIKVQVKSSEERIGDPTVSALYGKVGSNEFGLLVTLGTFTPQAKMFSRSKSNLRLVDGSELVDIVLNHYEQLDARYKGLIPLRQVYVPEVLEESE